MRLIIEDAECGCAYRPQSAAKQFACYRTSHVGAKAARHQVHAIQKDMVRARRLLMVDGQRKLVDFLSEFFDRRINEYCDRIMSQVRLSVEITRSASSLQAKAVEDITLSATADVWRSALVCILGESADMELISAYTPIIQSIAARSYERTATILGEGLADDRSVTILRRSQALAREVTSINETTRRHLSATLEAALSEGQTVAEAVRTIRAELPELASSRIPCIARTEIGNAIDQGTKQALKESNSVKTVCVIGCQSREARGPQYNGQSTCNIQRVPVMDIDKIRFHPNHTGALTVDEFFGED